MSKLHHNLIFNKEFQDALDVFSACFDARVTLFSRDRERLTTGNQKPHCAYCRLVRRTKKGRLACVRSDNILFDQAEKTKNTASGICHAGLYEAVYPVYLSNRVTGYIMLGQLLPEYITGKADKKIIRKYEAALKNKSQYRWKNINNILRLLNILASHIISSHLLRETTNEKFETILAYIKNHFREVVRLDDLTALSGLSRSSLVKMFKSMTGASFSRYIINLRLEAAEHFLMENPRGLIREAARTAGYRDEFFFSRIYQKHRGRAPAQFRKEYS